MFEVIRDNKGTVRILPDSEPKSWRSSVLGSFPSVEEAEAYVLRIREYVVLKNPEGNLFIVPTGRRTEHIGCKVVAAATTFTQAQKMLSQLAKA